MVLLISSLPLFHWVLFKSISFTLKKIFFKWDDIIIKNQKVIKNNFTKGMWINKIEDKILKLAWSKNQLLRKFYLKFIKCLLWATAA